MPSPNHSFAVGDYVVLEKRVVADNGQTVAALVNGEVRWSLGETVRWNQHFRPMLAAFVDTGRVFDDVALSLERWRFGYGLGFRFAWNLSTVVSFDYGRSEESDVLYMAFGHQF